MKPGPRTVLHLLAVGSLAAAVMAIAEPALDKPMNSEAKKRSWDRNFFSELRKHAVGDAIHFELVGGKFASGKISRLERDSGHLVLVAGELDQPEKGRFFFQKQARAGVMGDTVGIVEFSASQIGYRVEPVRGHGVLELIERPLGEVMCLGLPRNINAGTKPEGKLAFGGKTQAGLRLRIRNVYPGVPIPAYQNGIISLESLHGAIAVLYLDFQGGYTPTWGGVTYARPDVSNDQILEVLERVAEDFMPFNINVTTDLSVYQHAPAGSRQRVIITPSSFPVSDYGGLAYTGSFNWTTDVPCWCFNISGKACAETCSHELGHTLGLSHQGQNLNPYFAGQGQGETAWAPIMGLSLTNNVSQWSKGEYKRASNLEDELGVIASQNNNIEFRVDDTGATLATSRYLETYPDYSAGGEGVIERSDDVDAFQFTTTGGAVSLRADPVSTGPDLALQVALFDAQDQLLLTNNPQDTLWAALSTNLPAGTYTFRVGGAGRNNPLTNGFSSYASLGYYSITGFVANARLPDRFSVAEHATNGTVIGSLSLNDTNQHPLALSITRGNESGTFDLDDSGLLTVADSTSLDYETLSRTSALAPQFELLVAINDQLDGALSETNRRVVITVLPISTPPAITQQPADQSAAAGTNAAFQVAVTGSAPLNYQWFFANTPIAGATDAALSLTNVQAWDAGSYSATVSNVLGSATSVVANLSVIPSPPSIASNPVSQVVYPHGSASLGVAASGSEPFQYHWQFNGTNLAGATNAVLTITNISSDQLGDYAAAVINAAGFAVSAAALLSPVPVPPAVIRQPTNQVAYPNGSASFYVVAFGWEPFSYQWRLNGADVQGATNAMLLLDHINAAQMGLYSVIVSNSYGVMSSAKANLSISQVAAWGDDRFRQTNVPPGLVGVTKVACGAYHTLGLTGDGHLVTWTKPQPGTSGTIDYGQFDVPSGLSNVLDIAAGSFHNLALKRDGTVTAWGAGTNLLTDYNGYGQSVVPAGLDNVVAVAAGDLHSVALTGDGQVVVWGKFTFRPPSATNVIAIASAGSNILALRSDGVLVSWSATGEFPLISNVTAIAAGVNHRLALTSAGEVLSLDRDPAPVGLTNVVEVSAEATECLALRNDGTLVSWSSTNASAADQIPADFPFVNAIASGAGHNVAVLGDGSPQLRSQPPDRSVPPGAPVALFANAAGLPPLVYQWTFNGATLPDATNSSLMLMNFQSTNAGSYQVLVTNSMGNTTSREALVTFLVPLDQALDSSSLPWSTSVIPWFGETRITHDGLAAAQSGRISDGQQTLIQTTVVGPGHVSFWWKVSSEQWFDYLTFYLNGVMQIAISGEVDWQRQPFTVPAGTNTLVWSYAKDPTDSAGLDAAWLDQFEFVLDPPVIVQQPLSQTVAVGDSFKLSVNASGLPVLTYQWLKDGTNLPAQTLPFLSIQIASRHDSGLYAVAVSNAGGTTFSSNVLIRVLVPEKFGNPTWSSNRLFSVMAIDSDAAPLFPSDLTSIAAQFSTNLLDWQPWTNPLVLTNGKILLVDPGASNSSARFFRISEPVP